MNLITTLHTFFKKYVSSVMLFSLILLVMCNQECFITEYKFCITYHSIDTNEKNNLFTEKTDYHNDLLCKINFETPYIQQTFTEAKKKN